MPWTQLGLKCVNGEEGPLPLVPGTRAMRGCMQGLEPGRRTLTWGRRPCWGASAALQRHTKVIGDLAGRFGNPQCLPLEYSIVLSVRAPQVDVPVGSPEGSRSRTLR